MSVSRLLWSHAAVAVTCLERVNADCERHGCAAARTAETVPKASVLLPRLVGIALARRHVARRLGPDDRPRGGAANHDVRPS